METSNSTLGKIYNEMRVQDEGPYNHSENFSLTMAMAGDLDGDH